LNAGPESLLEKEVPRSSRGRVLALLLIVVLLAILALSPFYLVRFGWVREQLLTTGMGRLGAGERMRVRIGAVSQFTPVHLVLEDIALDAHAGSTWLPVTRADRVEILWSARDLLRGRIGVRSLSLDSLIVVLPRLQFLAAPGGDSLHGGGISRPRVPPISVHGLRLGGFRLEDSLGLVAGGDIGFRDLVIVSGDLSGELAGSVSAPRWGVGGALQGRFRTQGGRRIEVERMRIVAEGSRAEVTGWVEPSAPRPRLDLDVGLEPLRMPLLARILPPEFQPEAGDSVAGTVRVEYGGGKGWADLALRGRLRGERLQSFQGRVEAENDSAFKLTLDLAAEVGEVTGEITWNRARGEVDADLEWRGCDPRSSWLPWLAGLPHGDHPFDGGARAQIRLPAGEAPTIEGALSLRGARPWSVETREVAVRGRLEIGGDLHLDSLDVRLPHGGLQAHGLLPLGGDGGMDMAVTVDDAPLESLPPAWRSGLSGTLSGRVHAGGVLADPLLEGELRVEEPSWNGWRAAEVRGERLIFRPRDLRGAGYFELADFGRGAAWTGTSARVELARWSEELTAGVHLERERIEADLDLGLDPAGALRVDRATVIHPYLPGWTLERPFHLSWRGGGLRSDSLVLGSGAARLAAALDWRGAAGDLAARVGLQGFNLGLLNRWLAGGDSLKGEVNLVLSASGEWPAPALELALRCDGCAWGPLSEGRAAVQATWRDRTIALGPIDWTSPDHEIVISEIVVTDVPPLSSYWGAEGAADSSGGRAAFLDALAAAPWRGAVEIRRVDLGSYAQLLGLPQVAAAGGGSARHQLFVSGRAVPVRIVTPWDPERTPAATELGGELRGRILVAGTPRAPALQASGEVPDLRLGDTSLGDLRCALTFGDSLVRLDTLRLTREGRTTWGSGTYPLALSCLPPSARAGTQAIHLRAQLDQLDLALVSGLTRWVPDATGRLSGEIAVEGSGTAPQLRGTLTLADGGFRIPERSERIHDVSAVLSLGPEGLRIRELDARSGPQGKISAVGTYHGPEEFDFSAVVENVHAYEEARYDLLASGDLSAYTAPDPADGVVHPHLDGNVVVWSGTLTQDLAAREPTGPGRETPWLIDLDVEIPGNIRLSQVNTKADLGEGRLHVTYRWPYWNASGTLDVIGGTYRLLNNVFTITEGTVEFRDTGAGFDVTMDIVAETSVAVASSEDATSENFTVEVQVQGKPEQLDVSLTSVPTLSEEEIIELLSVGRFSRTGRFEAAAETQWILLNTMVDRIESSLLEQSPLFSRVGIAAGDSGEDPLRVTLRPVVTPEFLVHYSQELALDPARELSMNYRLGRGLYLRAGIARDRESSGAFSEEYSLDLRYRIEYE
jgi:hypothetical protein